MKELKKFIISLVFAFIEIFDLKKNGAQMIVVVSRVNKPPLLSLARTAVDPFTDMVAILNPIVRSKILWDVQDPKEDMLLKIWFWF